MRMGKRNPMSWTKRLKRWTGHPNAAQNISDPNKHTTKVVVEPEDIVLDTSDTSQKRYATIEREGRKKASTQPVEDTANEKKKPLETSISSPPPVCPRPDVGPTSAYTKKQPVGPSASSPPAVAPRPDERKTYVSVKKHAPNDVREDDADDDYTDVCDESRKPIADSPPAVAVRSDDRPYVSVKKYPTNAMAVTSTVEPAYVDKDSTAVCVTSAEAPDYVDVKPDGGDVTSSAGDKTASIGYVVVEPGSSENTTEQNAADAEQSGYVDLTAGVGASNTATQSGGSSDTLLRGRAGRQHDSVTKDDDGGKDARAGLKTWGSEKAGGVNDKDADRSCMTYVSVVGDKGTMVQEAPDSTAYLSIVPNATGLSGADAEQPGYVDLTPGVGEGSPTTQSAGSSDTLLRGRAGRQHDSLTGKDDDSGKDARAGLKTWANRPEKADVTNDKAYVSVLGDKGANIQDCATYMSVVPAV